VSTYPTVQFSRQFPVAFEKTFEHILVDFKLFQPVVEYTAIIMQTMFELLLTEKVTMSSGQCSSQISTFNVK